VPDNPRSVTPVVCAQVLNKVSNQAEGRKATVDLHKSTESTATHKHALLIR